MARKDYYVILGVPKGSSQEEIKKAYRELSKKHHPDKGGKEDDFKEISEAYSIIGDEEKRKKYDNGNYDQFQGFPGGFGGFGGGFNMDDVFDTFGFRQRTGKASYKQKGTDLRLKLSLTLDEIFSGVTKKVKYKKDASCPTCKGSGAANESSVHTCTKCGGSGWTQRMKQTIIGTVVSQEKCPDCNGEGKIIQSVCLSCFGKKTIYQEEVTDLAIMRGVRGGDVLSFPGYGNASRDGGANGDLLVFIEEIPNETFIRKDSELYIRQELDVCEAIFGKELEIKTIEGTAIKISIAPGTQSGTRFRVEGKGMYKMGTNYRGDMYIDISVFIPTNLSPKEKEILGKLKDSENIKPIKK